MNEFIRQLLNLNDKVSNSLVNVIGIILIALVIVSIISLFISICLAIKYVKYNRKKNSINKSGEEVARKILDENGLENIRVSKNGSILFGNSYSHYFKKVRLRRLTWKKNTVTSLAMAAQKSSLAVLDKENDPAMKLQIKLTPLIYFGPLAFIPLIIVGILIDIFLVNNNTLWGTLTCSILGLVFYLISFIFSILILKTEKKAQNKALELLKNENLATSEEIEDCKKLFRLYNIEYINNMVIALLELVYRVLLIIANVQGGAYSTSSNN